MAVQAGPTDKRYAANGVTTIYTIPFLLLEAGDLKVYLNGALVTAGFTLSGVGNPASTITFSVAPTGDLYLVLSVPFQRLVDYQENGDFLSSTVNRDFDRIWQALKQLYRSSIRSLMLGPNDVDGAGLYRANGNGISDLADPVSPQDAVNVRSMRTYVEEAIAGVVSGIGSFIQNYAGAVTRTFQDKMRDIVSAKDFGAVGDGTTSVVGVLATANAANPPYLTFPAGRYLVDASITINMPVRMDPGARFVIPTGVTLTISDSFESGVGYRFECSGTGKVVFGKNSMAEGYPEWWGATTNLMTDASAAFTAALLAVPGVVQLQAADYYAATSFKHPVAGKTLRGTGSHWFNKPSDSTRLISMSGSAHALIVGPETQPATINDFPQGIKVENLLVTRSVAPVIASGCAGVLSRWTLFQTMDDVKSAESMHGFQYQGTVQARTDNAHSFRSIAGTGAGTDFFRGFWIDGTTVLSGVAGGNASVHWDRCVAGCVLVGVNSYGMYVNGAWADTFIQNFEASVCTVGIYCKGDAQATINYKTVDLHIINPIIDQFTFAGIFVDGTSPFATISINGGYVAPVGTGTPTAGVYVLNSQGSVNISGGFQYICGPNTLMTAGLLVFASRNVISIGNVYMEASTSAVILQGATNCRIADNSMNYNNICQVGVKLIGSSNANKIDMVMSGGPGGMVVGVDLVADTNQRNEINATGIDSACITTTKVRRNGANISATGLSGTNLVSGVMT